MERMVTGLDIVYSTGSHISKVGKYLIEGGHNHPRVRPERKLTLR